MNQPASPPTTSSVTRRTARWWLACAAVVVLVGAVWGVQKWRGPQVPAVQVHAQSLVRTLQFSARVETRSRVGVGSTVVGRVERVAVREGDTVDAGQLLVQLEQTELQAALQQSQVLSAVREGAGSLLENIRLTDDYRGQGMLPGMKSLTFALRFRAPDRTLTAAEATSAKLAGAALAAERYGSTVRG